MGFKVCDLFCSSVTSARSIPAPVEAKHLYLICMGLGFPCEGVNKLWVKNCTIKFAALYP